MLHRVVNKMKARPKDFGAFEIMDWKFIIHLKPQQKWDVEETEKGYRLERDNVVIKLTKAEFEKHFKEITK